MIYVRLIKRQNPTSFTYDDILVPLDESGTPVETIRIPVNCEIYGVAVHSELIAFDPSNFQYVTTVILT